MVVIALGAATRLRETQVPQWADGTPFGRVAKSVEYPVYAIALGLIGNVILSRLALRDALSKGFRTGVLHQDRPGASRLPATIQALLLITVVFGFSWWLGGRLGLDDKLRALFPASGGAPGRRCRSAGPARPSQPPVRSIFLLPWLADLFGPSGVRCDRR